MSHERAFDRRAQPGTLGSKIRNLLQEMQERVVSLQQIRAYAFANDKTEIVKYLDNVLESFNELEKRYLSGKVMSEIQTASYIKDSPTVDKTIEKARFALNAANKAMNEENTEAKAEKRDILTLLQASTQQVVNDNFKNFSSPNSKFVTLINDIDKFEKTHKTKNATNASQFFSSQPKSTAASPQTAPGAKLKSGK